MRPERFLGSDPTPGDLGSLDRVSGVVRTVVLTLAESRMKVEALIAPHSAWQGQVSRPMVTALQELVVRLRTLEGATVDFAQAMEGWRSGLVARQQRRAELTERISQLAGRPDAEDERQRVLAEAQQLAAEHTSDGVALVSAAEGLTEALVDFDDEGDLASDLDRALTAISVAVEDWIAETASSVVATAESLSDTAGLTTVVSQILGVAGDEAPDEADNVRRLASVSAGAHRLRLALRRSWASLAPDDLPAASFADVGQRSRGQISDRLGGEVRAPSSDREAR